MSSQEQASSNGQLSRFSRREGIPRERLARLGINPLFWSQEPKYRQEKWPAYHGGDQQGKAERPGQEHAMSFKKERIPIQESCTEEFQNKAQRSKHCDPLDPVFPDPPEGDPQDGNCRRESEGNQVIDAYEMESEIQACREYDIDHELYYSLAPKARGLALLLLLLFHMSLSFLLFQI